MIGSPRSTCTIYRLKGKELEAARYTNRRGSMKGKVEVGKSYPCLGGTYRQYLHNFYHTYCNRFSPNYHLNDTHTISSCELRLLAKPRLKN